MAPPLRIGLIGFGNIGSGVVRTLQENRDLLDARCPRRLELRRVADVDLERERPVAVDRSLLTTEALEVIADPDIDVVVELIGGLDPARMFVETAIRAGKHVVTANKALLADCGAEILALAADKGVRVLFEAAVGGGIPVVRVLTECLAANRITRVEGILNGTCNYILTQMSLHGISYQEALVGAQELGYAEPDPTADVEGMDAAHKIAILASLAFEKDIRYEDVYREGITKLSPNDLHVVNLHEHGFIKHFAVAEMDPDGAVGVSVRPMILPEDDPLAGVDGVLNAVRLDGDPVGTVVLTGPGAGPGPTSSAVLSDLMWLSRLAEKSAPKAFLTIPIGRKPRKKTGRAYEGYWLGLSVRKRGLAGKIAEILVRSAIVIREIEEIPLQVFEDRDNPPYSIRVSILNASEENVKKAVEELRAAGFADTDDVRALPIASFYE